MSAAAKKGLLKSLGKATTYDAMFQELPAAGLADLIKFATADTTIPSADQIHKLCRLLECAQQVGCYPQLKGMQLNGRAAERGLQNGAPQSVCPVIARVTAATFRWVVQRMCQKDLERKCLKAQRAL